jgi:hypothetical protein
MGWIVIGRKFHHFACRQLGAFQWKGEYFHLKGYFSVSKELKIEVGVFFNVTFWWRYEKIAYSGKKSEP